MFAPGLGTFALGEPRLDAALRGGLARGAVHEVLADPAHPATAGGFALALAIRACEPALEAGAMSAYPSLTPWALTGTRPASLRERDQSRTLPGGRPSRTRPYLSFQQSGRAPSMGDHPTSLEEGDHADSSAKTSPMIGVKGQPCGSGPIEVASRTVVWVRQEAAAIEAGGVYGPGLAALGLDPARLLLVHLRTAVDVMRAALEATRCAAVGAVIIETVDRGGKIDLTATRRLKLAAEKGGVTAILLRAAGETVAGAVETRWRVRPTVASPDQPSFDITLLRHRAGIPETRWQVEWDHEQRAFATATAAAALSQPLGPLPPRRPLAA